MPPRLKRKREDEEDPVSPDTDPLILPGTDLTGPSSTNAPPNSFSTSTSRSFEDPTPTTSTTQVGHSARNDGHNARRRRVLAGSGVGAEIGAEQTASSSPSHIATSHPSPSTSQITPASTSISGSRHITSEASGIAASTGVDDHDLDPRELHHSNEAPIQSMNAVNKTIDQLLLDIPPPPDGDVLSGTHLPPLIPHSSPEDFDAKYLSPAELKVAANKKVLAGIKRQTNVVQVEKSRTLKRLELIEGRLRRWRLIVPAKGPVEYTCGEFAHGALILLYRLTSCRTTLFVGNRGFGWSHANSLFYRALDTYQGARLSDQHLRDLGFLNRVRLAAGSPGWFTTKSPGRGHRSHSEGRGYNRWLVQDVRTNDHVRNLPEMSLYLPSLSAIEFHTFDVPCTM